MSFRYSLKVPRFCYARGGDGILTVRAETSVQSASARRFPDSGDRGIGPPGRAGDISGNEKEAEEGRGGRGSESLRGSLGFRLLLFGPASCNGLPSCSFTLFRGAIFSSSFSALGSDFRKMLRQCGHSKVNLPCDFRAPTQRLCNPMKMRRIKTLTYSPA